MSNDVELYSSIAANLDVSGWSSIFASMDTDTFSKIQSSLDKLKDVSDVPDEKLNDDPQQAIKQLNAKLTKLMKGLKAHRGRFKRLEQRMTTVEVNSALGGGSSIRSTHYERAVGIATPTPIKGNTSLSIDIKPIKKRNKRKLKSMAKHDDIKDDNLKDRKHFYKFGYRNLQVLLPSVDYPIKKYAQRPVEGKLQLMWSHGYSGNFDESRQNICLSSDGTKLLYYIAAIAVVYDYNNNSQRFFTKHNDDLTSICISPNKTWAATGQKDPKDEPGQGKDLPKIWVWNYKTMKKVQLIDNVCWGKIGRLQWSSATNLLYCICGDPEQTLKAYDPKEMKGKKQPDSLINVNTMKEAILGFEINKTPNKAYFDEFIMYGKRKFCHVGIIQKGKKLSAKIKAVSIVPFYKEGEKYFGCAQWLPDGRYIVGAQSGAIYIGRENKTIALIGEAHGRSVGCLLVTGSNVISAGFDKTLKRWKILKNTSGSSSTSGSSPSSPIIKKKTKKKGDKKKGNKKAVPVTAGPKVLEEKWSCEVNLPDTDYILQPKAMAYNNKTGTLFVGSKTNQIMKFEMKEEKGEVIVDGHDGQIWGLCTHPTQPLFATGGYDNAVKIWDATTKQCIKTVEFELDQGVKKGKEISCAAWSNDGACIVFGTEDSCIAIFSWDTDNQELLFQQMIEIPPKSINAEVEPVAYLRFSDDSSMLGAAHMDSNLYIYSVQSSPGKVILQQWPAALPHIAAPVNVQWSEDNKLVKTLTRDYEVVHWYIDKTTLKGKFIPRIPDPDKVKWADDPLIAGWDVEGLYQRGWDGTDLNDATITSDGRLVATGDDYGKVRLHNYPSTDNKTCLEYGGHAEFVVGVEFLRDDSQLITCGGADMAIFQWKCYKNYKD